MNSGRRFQHSLLVQLLQPSMGGGLAALGFAFLTLIIGRLPSLSKSLYNLYIPQAIHNIESDVGHSTVNLLTHHFHGYADNSLLILFWVLTGIVIYSLLHGLGGMFIDLEEDIEERRYLWPSYANRNSHLILFITKLGFRIAILIMLTLYTLIGIPKIIHSLNNNLDKGGTFATQFYHYALFIVVAWLLAQGFIVLLRFLTLRVRLF
ncbi:MAG TPA: hypothetical protein VLF79_02170 [Candidatus Saccharimonadales bacterium]|nr:hypothetical protein [Candidatus Saccharimonadales bacterium]